MKIILIALSLIITPIIHANTNSGRPEVTKFQCKNVKADIARNKQRMRQGYSVNEGNRLNAERRVLDLVLRDCKKKRYPTK